MVQSFTNILDPGRKWYNNRRLLVLNAWLALLWITASTEGYEGSMINGLQSLSQWQHDFGYPSPSMLGFLTAMRSVGGLAAFPFAPMVTDGLGRRRGIFLGSVIMLVGAILQGAANGTGMFLAARFLLGFGGAFAANSAPLLVSEIAYPSQRAALTSMYNSLWYLGAIIAAWTTFATFQIPNTWSWRIPSFLQGLPSVFQASLVLFAPESPRWLVSQKRDKEALETLAYYHADGNKDDPLVRYEFEEIKAAMELERTAKRVGYLSFLTTPSNRKRIYLIMAIGIFSEWSGNGLPSYFLNRILNRIGITNDFDQLLINGFLSIWNLLWSILASLCVEKVGRRFLFLSSSGGMLVFWTAQTICFATGTRSSGYALIVFMFLFFAAFDLAFTPLVVSYPVEILPFEIRAKGMNILSLVVAMAMMLNQAINPVALELLKWKYYIFYCFVLVFEVVYLYRNVVETKGLTLEETAALFEEGQAGIFVENTPRESDSLLGRSSRA